MDVVERKEKELRKKEILRAAKAVFKKHGFQLTTMKGIAEKARLSGGTLYLYFKNKEELFTVLSMEMLQFLSFELKKVVEEKQLSVQEKLYASKNILIKIYEYDPKVLINLFHLQSAVVLKKLPSDVLDKIKRLSASSINIIASIIQEGMDKEIFRKEHPVAIADTIWGIFTGVVLWVESKRQLDPEKDFVKKTLNTAMNIIFDGLKIEETAAV